MARYASVRFTFGGFSTGYSTWYLVLFLGPPRPRFQAICTVTKTWRVNSPDHWLAGENHHYCITELATQDPTIFKSAQPAKDQTELLLEQTHLFVSSGKANQPETSRAMPSHTTQWKSAISVLCWNRRKFFNSIKLIKDAFYIQNPLSSKFKPLFKWE